MAVAHDGTSTEPAGFAGPLLSVIVPVYNSQTELEQCLSALAKSHYEDFEVWVVDYGSVVPIKPIADAYGFGSIRIDGPSGPARARNQGVEKARGRHLIFIDADVSVHRDTLALFADAFARDQRIDAVVGSYDDAPACPNFISQYKNLFHHYVHQNSRGEIQTFWSGCGAMKRDLFLAFGGYDQQRYRQPACEDIDLGMRVAAAGHHVILDARIKAKHLKRWTFWSLLRTDVFDRGIPWTRLILRSDATICTLNVTPVQRLSVVLVCLTLLALLTAALWPSMAITAAALALIVTLLNLDFYRFFLRQRGFWFMLRVIPMHWVYFLCCGLSAVAGTLLYLLERNRNEICFEPQAAQWVRRRARPASIRGVF
jgi:Glycosyl transferase family 2